MRRSLEGVQGWCRNYAALADADLRPRVLDARGRLWPYLQLFADSGQVTDLDAPAGATLDILAAAEGG